MADSLSYSQDHLTCPICLELFKLPVTTACGHSFCMDCIKSFWDRENRREIYSCPKCRSAFFERPNLSRSIVLSGLIEDMRKEVPAGPGDVKCDVCKGGKLKAVKSCLGCLASFCQTHVRPHYESQAFKTHKLVNALSNLKQHICPQHHKALEIYCYNDRKCVCVVCMGDKHSVHTTVSAPAEMAKKKDELKIKKRDLDQKVADIDKKVQAYRQAVDSHSRSAQAAVEHSDRIFSHIIRSFQKRRTEVREKIRAHEAEEIGQMKNHIQELEKDISNLRKEDGRLEPLLQTEDHIYFFQNYSQSAVSLCSASPREVNDLLTYGNVDQSVSALKSQLDKICKEHMDIISKKVADVQVFRTTTLENNKICPIDALYRLCTDQRIRRSYIDYTDDDTEDDTEDED